MNKFVCAVLTALCLLAAMALTGCVPDDLPPGDRDEIGLESDAGGDAGPVSSDGPVGWRNAESRQPAPVDSKFEADPRPAFVTLGEADGPSPDGKAVTAMAEVPGLLWLDRDGTGWADCEVLNEAAGEDLVRESDGGSLFFRDCLLPVDDFVWDLDSGRLLMRLEVLKTFCGTSGLDEMPAVGIEPGEAVSDKDRPVLDAVLGAMQPGDIQDFVTFSFGMCARYSYNHVTYAKSGGEAPVSTEIVPQDPDGTVFDGRRVWYDRDDSLLVDGGDGMAYWYFPEA